jgi:rSAM/selenodomain-associated transferase 2
MNSSVLASSANDCLDVSVISWRYSQIWQASLLPLLLIYETGHAAFYSRFTAKSLAHSADEGRLAGNQSSIPSMESSAVSTKVRLTDRGLAGDLEKGVQTRLSIIVPVANEAPLIRPFLQHLRDRAPGAEIIIADGRSSDGTDRLAARLCDQLVESDRGRAIQMNTGARIAHGDMLWFVHVDAEVPRGCLNEIWRIMDDPNLVGGYFRIRLPQGLIYRLTDNFAHYAGILLRMRCGDHGIFCRRTAFLDIGGFPEVPLMEDVEFFRRLHRLGRVQHSEQRIIVSPRRYKSVGRVRLTLAYGLIATLYIFGLPLSVLARIYRRMCCDASEGSAPEG